MRHSFEDGQAGTAVMPDGRFAEYPKRGQHTKPIRLMAGWARITKQDGGVSSSTWLKERRPMKAAVIHFFIPQTQT